MYFYNLYTVFKGKWSSQRKMEFCAITRYFEIKVILKKKVKLFYQILVKVLPFFPKKCKKIISFKQFSNASLLLHRINYSPSNDVRSMPVRYKPTEIQVSENCMSCNLQHFDKSQMNGFSMNLKSCFHKKWQKLLHLISKLYVYFQVNV